jgi:two-component system, OmpR family, sensor histidine kinase MprB
VRWPVDGLTLRSRITLIAAVAVAATVVAVSVAAFLVVRGQLGQQMDTELGKDASTVAEAPDEWSQGGRPADPDHDHDHDLAPRVQVLDADGDRAGGTARLPVTGAARQVADGRADRAYETVHVGGEEYRMLTLACHDRPGAVQVASPLTGQERTLQRFGALMVLVGVGGVAVAALLGWWVARAGLRPVDRLTAAVEHVADTADLSRRIQVRGRDEVARLGAAFNAMLAALGSSRAAQRLLVEDAGHELRTPLTSLRANIELLIRADSEHDDGRRLTAADRTRLLADLDAQTTELTQLVGELVDLARDDAGTEPAEELDLADLVDAAVQRVRARAPGARITTDLSPVTRYGRPASLDRMVVNLLDNALKWGPPGTPVEVGLREVGGVAELTVADAGPGVDPADVPRIFERFYRAPGARAVPGSGLGLAIVAQAAALHGGTVAVSRSAAGGALFTVSLPDRR